MASVRMASKQPLGALDDLDKRLQELPERWLPRVGELRGLADGWLAAWNAHDIDQLVELVTEDVVWEDPGMLGETVTGRAGFRAFAETFFRAFPDVRFEPMGSPYLALDGSSVAVGWRMTATFAGELSIWGEGLGPRPPAFSPTGRRIDIEGIDLYELRDGRVARWTLRYDLFAASQQMGLVPATNSRWLRPLLRAQRLMARILRRHP